MAFWWALGVLDKPLRDPCPAPIRPRARAPLGNPASRPDRPDPPGELQADHRPASFHLSALNANPSFQRRVQRPDNLPVSSDQLARPNFAALLGRLAL